MKNIENNKVYTLSEFCKILKESQEFKAKIGGNVESENKKNNEKAVKDILKQGKDYDGGVRPDQKRENPRDIDDYNKTTLDYDFTYEPSDEYKERVKAQVHGFPSVQNEKNADIDEDTNGGLDYEGNKEFYDQQAEKRKKVADARQTDKHAGLKSHNLPKEIFKDNTLYTNESKKMKRFHFKKTVFLNEEHMFTKIPDDAKFDGNKFYMKDAVGNEYLIECKNDEAIKGVVHTNVVSFENKEMINEAFDKMKKLYSYKSSEVSQKSNINESKMLNKMMQVSKDKFAEANGEKNNQ